MKTKDVKKLSPIERLMYWITEREKIRIAKESGEPKPWTDDEILQSYRFCNVRRMDDKVSRWLLENWYEPYRDHPNILPAVALARFINLPSSLEKIERWVFRRKHAPLWENIKQDLREMKKQGVIFNGAYMVRGNDGMDKVECVVDYYVRPLVENKIKVVPCLMEQTWENVFQSYGMGSFMAGQIVADLRWAVTGDWEDRNEWAPMGPGSKRGINRLNKRNLKSPLTQVKFLGELQDVIEICKHDLPKTITGRLEAMDYQNCLCEFDKMERTIWGEGKPKQRYLGI